ncbi:MAG TPA: RDD family protein [Trebonia sp.]
MSDAPRDPRRASAVRLAAAPNADAGDTTPDYPGKRFGLPQEGPGSVAPMGRRLLALIIDWLLCELIVSAVTRHSLIGVSDHAYTATQDWTLLVCALEICLLTAVSGLTVGKRMLGIRVIRTDGRRPGLGWAALRTLLLFFVVPPLLSDRDLRGLHDRAADTIVVRM